MLCGELRYFMGARILLYPSAVASWNEMWKWVPQSYLIQKSRQQICGAGILGLFINTYNPGQMFWDTVAKKKK